MSEIERSDLLIVGYRIFYLQILFSLASSTLMNFCRDLCDLEADITRSNPDFDFDMTIVGFSIPILSFVRFQNLGGRYELN